MAGALRAGPPPPSELSRTLSGTRRSGTVDQCLLTRALRCVPVSGASPLSPPLGGPVRRCPWAPMALQPCFPSPANTHYRPHRDAREGLS